MFGLQAAINMMVNVHLMPAKGMTLPFISYGGSSLLSLALGMGFLVALTRRRPRAESMDRFAALASRMTGPLILLSAGGTGGHLFPAEALANALKAGGRARRARDGQARRRRSRVRSRPTR